MIRGSNPLHKSKQNRIFGLCKMNSTDSLGGKPQSRQMKGEIFSRKSMSTPYGSAHSMPSTLKGELNWCKVLCKHSPVKQMLMAQHHQNDMACSGTEAEKCGKRQRFLKWLKKHCTLERYSRPPNFLRNKRRYKKYTSHKSTNCPECPECFDCWNLLENDNINQLRGSHHREKTITTNASSKDLRFKHSRLDPEMESSSSFQMTENSKDVGSIESQDDASICSMISKREEIKISLDELELTIQTILDDLESESDCEMIYTNNLKIREEKVPVFFGELKPATTEADAFKTHTSINSMISEKMEIELYENLVEKNFAENDLDSIYTVIDEDVSSIYELDCIDSVSVFATSRTNTKFASVPHSSNTNTSPEFVSALCEVNSSLNDENACENSVDAHAVEVSEDDKLLEGASNRLEAEDVSTNEMEIGYCKTQSSYGLNAQVVISQNSLISQNTPETFNLADFYNPARDCALQDAYAAFLFSQFLEFTRNFNSSEFRSFLETVKPIMLPVMRVSSPKNIRIMVRLPLPGSITQQKEQLSTSHILSLCHEDSTPDLLKTNERLGLEYELLSRTGKKEENFLSGLRETIFNPFNPGKQVSASLHNESMYTEPQTISENSIFEFLPRFRASGNSLMISKASKKIEDSISENACISSQTKGISLQAQNMHSEETPNFEKSLKVLWPEDDFDSPLANRKVRTIGNVSVLKATDLNSSLKEVAKERIARAQSSDDSATTSFSPYKLRWTKDDDSTTSMTDESFGTIKEPRELIVPSTRDTTVILGEADVSGPLDNILRKATSAMSQTNISQWFTSSLKLTDGSQSRSFSKIKESDAKNINIPGENHEGQCPSHGFYSIGSTSTQKYAHSDEKNDDVKQLVAIENQEIRSASPRAELDLDTDKFTIARTLKQSSDGIQSCVKISSTFFDRVYKAITSSINEKLEDSGTSSLVCAEEENVEMQLPEGIQLLETFANEKVNSSFDAVTWSGSKSSGSTNLMRPKSIMKNVYACKRKQEKSVHFCMDTEGWDGSDWKGPQYSKPPKSIMKNVYVCKRKQEKSVHFCMDTEGWDGSDWKGPQYSKPPGIDAEILYRNETNNSKVANTSNNTEVQGNEAPCETSGKVATSTPRFSKLSQKSRDRATAGGFRFAKPCEQKSNIEEADKIDPQSSSEFTSITPAADELSSSFTSKSALDTAAVGGFGFSRFAQLTLSAVSTVGYGVSKPLDFSMDTVVSTGNSSLCTSKDDCVGNTPKYTKMSESELNSIFPNRFRYSKNTQAKLNLASERGFRYAGVHPPANSAGVNEPISGQSTNDKQPKRKIPHWRRCFRPELQPQLVRSIRAKRDAYVPHGFPFQPI